MHADFLAQCLTLPNKGFLFLLLLSHSYDSSDQAEMESLVLTECYGGRGREKLTWNWTTRQISGRISVVIYFHLGVSQSICCRDAGGEDTVLALKWERINGQTRNPYGNSMRKETDLQRSIPTASGAG